MNSLLHEYQTQVIVQKFFKPNSDHFILFKDEGISCPDKENVYRTNFGRVSISVVCYDCKSFAGWNLTDERIFCLGKADFAEEEELSVKDFLDLNEEQVKS